MSEEARAAARAIEVAASNADSAARSLRHAAEEGSRVSANIEGTLERARMFWEREVLPELTAMVERLEAAAKIGDKVYDCNICGGRVDLSNPKAPSIDFGMAGRIRKGG